MKQENKVYLAQLLRLLYQEAVDGRRIGEMVAEIDQHLAESGADPVDEFGPPAVLAAELAGSPGSKRPGWIPPRWLLELGAFALLVLVMPLLTPYLWEESSIPVTRYAVTYTIVFYLGVYWIGYAANKRLDGRTRKALGWPFGLALLALSVGVGLVVGIGGQADLLSVPKIPYLVVSAVAGSALLAVLIRFNNPVRFP